MDEGLFFGIKPAETFIDADSKELLPVLWEAACEG